MLPVSSHDLWRQNLEYWRRARPCEPPSVAILPGTRPKLRTGPPHYSSREGTNHGVSASPTLIISSGITSRDRTHPCVRTHPSWVASFRKLVDEIGRNASTEWLTGFAFESEGELGSHPVLVFPRPKKHHVRHQPVVTSGSSMRGFPLPIHPEVDEVQNRGGQQEQPP